MKRTELLQAMERMLPNSTAGVKHVNFPLAATAVAAYAFIHELPDDNDAGLIKEYLLFLGKHGYFTFEDGI